VTTVNDAQNKASSEQWPFRTVREMVPALKLVEGTVILLILSYLLFSAMIGNISHINEPASPKINKKHHSREN